jgi:membrane fusion protein, heavy metal efflux system
MALAISGRRMVPQLVSAALIGFAICALAVVAANLTHDSLFHGSAVMAAPTGGQDAPRPGPEGAQPANQITLPEGKLKVAGIQLEPATLVELPAEVVVAGQIEANPYRRVEIRPRASGIVRTADVSPAQQVKAGQLLAMLESADVGTARLNLRARQFELSVARTESEWKSTVAANVETLIPELRKGIPAAILEKQYAGKLLGAHRAELLATYADLEIASHEETKQTAFYRENLVGEHPAFVAMHTREAAQAKFEAALEQVRFDAALQKLQAEQQVRKSEAGVIDAFKRLQLLGVNYGPGDPLSEQVDVLTRMVAAEDVTAYPLLAPFDATIISMACVVSQRADLTDVLFTLADLKTVRVVGNISETELGALPALKNGLVRVTAAAYPRRTFEAKMLYTSPNVDPTTRRVSLVAESQNPDGLLKLGMFVSMHLESSNIERVLTVPASAVKEIDGKKGVFVPGHDSRTFVLRTVITGRDSSGRQVIKSGLAPGQKVVTTGAFMLKSELELQNQPKEE